MKYAIMTEQEEPTTNNSATQGWRVVQSGSTQLDALYFVSLAVRSLAIGDSLIQKAGCTEHSGNNDIGIREMLIRESGKRSPHCSRAGGREVVCAQPDR